MMRLPANFTLFWGPRRFRGQGMVEFALILPVMLLVIFVVIELARLLHAYLAIENGARFGVRYAVTGEYNTAYCPAGVCDSRAEEDAARLPSIKDVARAGSTSILRDESVPQGSPSYFLMTVCSSRDEDGDDIGEFQLVDPVYSTFTPSRCERIAAPGVRVEDVGGPGDRVSVTLDFDHPLIVPILSTYWPKLHLTASREGIIEQFRVTRVLALPATISAPTLTPSDTATPTITDTPSETPTPTITDTPSATPTPTDTFTPSSTPSTTATPTVTATPSCALLSIGGLSVSQAGAGAWIIANVTNGNTAPMSLTDSFVDWDKFYGSQVLDAGWFNGIYYRPLGTVDASPPTADAANIPLAGGA